MKTIVKYAMEKCGYDTGGTDEGFLGMGGTHYMSANRGMGGDDPISALQAASQDPRLSLGLVGYRPSDGKMGDFKPESIGEYLKAKAAERLKFYEERGEKPGHYWDRDTSWTLTAPVGSFGGGDDEYSRFSKYIYDKYPTL